MEIEGGGTVLLRGGAEMGSTVLVGMRLKETDFGVSERGEIKCNEREHDWDQDCRPGRPSLG